jgi:Uma2 family endonuclease
MSSRSLEKSKKQERQSVPPLHPGDRLSQREFHRRYEAYEDDTKFELIGGIVYMMAPAGFEHGKSGFDICGLLLWYEARTPGVVGVSGATVILSDASEPQPDVALLIAPEYGGQTKLKRIRHKDYVEGPPELILEVAHSTVAIDLHAKRDDYRTNGVLEYIVICLEEGVIRWFDLPSDQELRVDKQGVLKSVNFPGLWIDTVAFFQRNSGRMMKTLERGIANKDHEEFVKKLAARHTRGSSHQPKKYGKTGA